MYRSIALILFAFLLVMVGCGVGQETSKVVQDHINLEKSQFVSKSNLHIKTETEQKSNEETTNSKDENETTESDQESDKEEVPEDKENQDESSTEEQPKEEEIAVQSVEKMMYVNYSSLNVRGGNGTDYQVVGQVALNDNLKVTGKTENDWYQFDYQGQEAYVSGHYLSENKVEVETASKDKDDQSETDSEKTEESEEEDDKNSNNNSSQPLIAKTNMAQQSNQILTVVHNGGGRATIQYWKKSNGNWQQDLSVNGFVGKNGVSSQKVEGDGMTPTGVYRFNFAFGTQNPGTKLDFRTITNQSYWISNGEDPDYNTWQERESSSSKDEYLIQYANQYKYAMALNYNTYNRVPGEGSAIFLHVSNGSPTLGCISVPESTMHYLMQDIGGQAQIAIVHSEQDLLNY